jgi:hypothetical protein
MYTAGISRPLGGGGEMQRTYITEVVYGVACNFYVWRTEICREAVVCVYHFEIFSSYSLVIRLLFSGIHEVRNVWKYRQDHLVHATDRESYKVNLHHKQKYLTFSFFYGVTIIKNIKYMPVF